jgi:hypothetical protein
MQGSNKVMKSILVKPFSKLANLILLSGAIFVLAACSDSAYNAPGGEPDDTVIVIVTPPDEPEALSVVISGVVVDKVTGSVINDARVDFFEGLEKATNIILPDGTATDGEDLANGSFQVSANDIDQFRVEASANGYAYNSAIVNIEEDAQVVYVIVKLLGDGFEKSKEVFTDSIGEDFAVKAEGITLTSDDSAGDKTTEGQAEVAITGGIQFLDENDQVIEVAAVNLEVSYIETQEATDEDEEVLSIADVIPEGLNSDDAIEEVLVPVGVTEVNMTDENGTPIKNFSGDITITLYLPATTIDPATGSPITTDSNFRVRTYDEETQVWTTEPEDAVTVLAQQGDLFPVEVTVDHLTIFALTAEVTACANDATLNFTGSALPATGLDVMIEAGDLRQTYAISSNSLVISKDDLLKDEDGYKIYVTDSSGESWLAVEEEPEPEEPQAPAESVVTIPDVEASTQHVYVSESTLSEDGTQAIVTVSHNATGTLTGLGLRIHYDSSALTLTDIADVFAASQIVAPSLTASVDTEDFDGDATTDAYVIASWAAIFGTWTPSSPQELMTLTFDIAESATGSAAVNFTASSTSSGYTFAGQEHDVVLSVDSAEPVSDGYKLCSDEATTFDLVAPTQPVTFDNKNLTLNLQCTNDSLVTIPLTTAVVSYFSDSNPIPVVAEVSAGSYQLTGLTEGSTYTVTVDTRTGAGIVVYDANNNGIGTNNTDETRNIGISCSTATGTGTGSS